MAEDTYVEPLSGEEIIQDLCCQIADKLRRDCNLRDTDSYQGGYSATVTINLKAYGLDETAIETRIVTDTPGTPGEPDELIHTQLEIPVEDALNTVRERSDQPVPTLTELESGQQVVRPRRYTRRGGGGATGETV